MKNIHAYHHLINMPYGHVYVLESPFIVPSFMVFPNLTLNFNDPKSITLVSLLINLMLLKKS
jgi:hypothetical protein